MNIHEYQAKTLLRRYGVPVLEGAVAETPQEAVAAAVELSGPVWVVKAQVHAGGRGKACGVAVARSVGEVAVAAHRMLGMRLVTPQTGPEGIEVSRVYVEEGCRIARELYLAMLIDRRTGGVTVVASTEGGTEIEEVAAKAPEKVLRLTLPPATELQPFHARWIAFALGLRNEQVAAATRLLTSLSNAFVDLDATLVEINPLAVTSAGDLVALDAKMSLDENALFRHRDLQSLLDAEGNPLEVEAARHDLNYVKLDGDIGCMVNGAGLAMATMDIIRLHGGTPANFMDIAGAATRERVAAAFRLVASDPAVRGILVNVFGGMMRCDAIAEGIVEAARAVAFDRPLVVRLEGTNVERGRRILRAASVPIIAAATLGEAAAAITRAVGAARPAAERIGRIRETA